MKKAEKIFVRIEFPNTRVLKENITMFNLYRAPMGRIVGFEDENGVECTEAGFPMESKKENK